MPSQNGLASGKAIFKTAYAVIPQEVMKDIVVSYFPHWTLCRAWVLARPMTGFSETFSQSIIEILGKDAEDLEKKIDIPIQVLWGKHGLINKCFNPIEIWQKYSKKVVIGESLNCHHFIPEEIPKILNKKLMQFLK